MSTRPQTVIIEGETFSHYLVGPGGIAWHEGPGNLPHVIGERIVRDRDVRPAALAHLDRLRRTGNCSALVIVEVASGTSHLADIDERRAVCGVPLPDRAAGLAGMRLVPPDAAGGRMVRRRAVGVRCGRCRDSRLLRA